MRKITMEECDCQSQYNLLMSDMKSKYFLYSQLPFRVESKEGDFERSWAAAL